MISMAFTLMFMQIARRTFTGVSTRVEGAPGGQPLPQFSFCEVVNFRRLVASALGRARVEL